MKLLFIALTCISLPAQAAPKERKEPPKAHVIQLDPDFPVEALEGKGIQVHKLEKRPQSRMLIPAVQDLLFQKAGLTEAVKEWDALDRDRLAMRAENQSPEEVSGRYGGKIPAEKIAKLAELIKQYRIEKETK